MSDHNLAQNEVVVTKPVAWIVAGIISLLMTGLTGVVWNNNQTSTRLEETVKAMNDNLKRIERTLEDAARDKYTASEASKDWRFQEAVNKQLFERLTRLEKENNE